MKTKKIMILGGSENQVPFLKKAQELGHFVILCDYNENCIGKEFCDKFYLVSINDKESLTKIAKEEKIDGIITNSEPVLHIVSMITEELNLPAVPLNIMQLFRNKQLMRDKLNPIGLSDVKYKMCNTIEEAKNFFDELNKQKMIMKPLDNSSSRGVYTIYSEKDIEDYFYESLNSNRNNQSVLLEEYIEGPEFTVDGICIDGKHTTLAISKKKHYSYNENVAYELFFSYEDDEYNYDEIRELNDKIVAASGLNFAMTHAEYKYSNGKFHLIEIAARGGGAFISTMIVPYVSGIDTTRLLINASLGINESFVQNKEYRDRVAVLEFLNTPQNKSGYVKAIKGLDIFENNSNIIKYELEFKVGDFIKPAMNDAERIGYYIACHKNKSELLKLMKSIDENLVIELGGNNEKNN